MPEEAMPEEQRVFSGPTAALRKDAPASARTIASSAATVRAIALSHVLTGRMNA
jgi:hypothetical protein